MSENKGKDTIYIDVDEEITGIVSKIQSSPKDIVALVLPKRASVLQSIVNMKLIKRTADQNDKKVVLITSESRLLPLAGASGLFVASNLTSKPFVPPSPKIDGQELGGDEGTIDPNTPVSEVAPDAKFADDDAIEIDNRPKPSASPVKDAKSKKKKGPKVPNFGKFRTKLIIGLVAGLFLIIGLIWAFLAAPKADVVLKAKTSELPVNVSFVADTSATEFDKEGKVVRATKKETEKQDSEKAPATGQKNKGQKASGSITMTARKCGGNPFSAPSSVAAGTGVSYNGNTYITQQSTAFTTSGATTDSQGCYVYPSTGNTSITAQSAGAASNVSNGSFSVAGRSDASATGDASGGTDDIVKVVSKTDVDKAKERLSGKSNTVQDDMKKELEREGYIAITSTFKATPSDYSPSPAVDSEASEVTVSVTTKYEMLGVKEDDLKELIKQDAEEQQQGQPQNILSEGLESASFNPSSTGGSLSSSQTAFSVDTTVVTGPDINEEEVKNQITGKKKGEAEEILKQKPGIVEPTIELKPFWVSKVPKPSKITIEVKQADGSAINP